FVFLLLHGSRDGTARLEKKYSHLQSSSNSAQWYFSVAVDESAQLIEAAIALKLDLSHAEADLPHLPPLIRFLCRSWAEKQHIMVVVRGEGRVCPTPTRERARRGS